MSIIAITGATGFVGRNFVKQVEGYNLTPRLLVRSPEKAKDLSQYQQVCGDLDDKRALSRLCRGADVLVHIAGKIMANSAQEFQHANVAGTKNVTEAATKAGVKRIILISSLAARSPDLTAYGKSKKDGEDALITHHGNTPYVILRPPAVYGPGDEGTFPLLKALTQRYAVLPGQKHSRVSIIHVDDLARAIIRLVDCPLEKISSQKFEIHDGRKNGYNWYELAHIAGLVEEKAVECIFMPRTALNFIAAICMLYGRLLSRVPYMSFDKVKELYHEDWICRNNLLNNTGLWNAELGFSDGFRETVKWYRVNGWLS